MHRLSCTDFHAQTFMNRLSCTDFHAQTSDCTDLHGVCRAGTDMVVGIEA
jgi:hypothetical protein